MSAGTHRDPTHSPERCANESLRMTTHVQTRYFSLPRTGANKLLVGIGYRPPPRRVTEYGEGDGSDG